ncbi:MAG: ribonuclease D [Dehalococcoidia bacterium]
MTADRVPDPVTDPSRVAAIANAIRDAGAFALDLEFMTDGRYVADLSLVQVAWGDPEAPDVAAIDPLVVDAVPVLTLAGDPDVETVLHSAQADLALIGQQFGIRGRAVFDTQIGAALIGMGDQIGYAALVERVCGVRLDKGAQFTEWSRRPLSPDQLSYALDDVRYLARVWRAVRADLEERNRLGWLIEESDRLAETWAERVPPEQMYRRVRGWNGLRRRSQGALRALAAWREREALRANRPPSWLMNDRTMFELCRRLPEEEQAVREIRGLGDSTIQRYGQAILAALREGADDPPPPEAKRPAVPPQGRAWPAILSGIVQAGCRDANVAARFVATRSDIDALVAWWLVGDRSEEPDLAVLSGWRRTLAGEAMLDWLRGETTIAVDPESEAGVRIVRAAVPGDASLVSVNGASAHASSPGDAPQSPPPPPPALADSVIPHPA